MMLLRLYLELKALFVSALYLLSFPFSIASFVLGIVWKRIMLRVVSIGFIQKLLCPRFGSSVFSRFGRIFFVTPHIHVFFGGSLAGVAILFFLYQPIFGQFDGKYYVTFNRPSGVSFADASELREPILTATTAAVIETSMPIVTTSAPEPIPVAPAITRTSFIPPQTVAADFVPPNITGTTFQSPLHNPPRLMITSTFTGYHPGLDLATEIGTPIYPVADGYVQSVGSTIWAYGNVVYINHGNGIVSLYAHMSRVDVKPGQVVTKGTVIGAVGSTGNSSGPHVHFEIHKDNVPLNPRSAISSF